MTVSFFALGVSALALVLSIAGFYWQWLRVGTVTMVVGPDLRVDIDDYGLPRFLAQVVLMNDGARSVAIVEIRGSVESRAADARAALEWASFAKSSRIVAGEAGHEPVTPWDFTGRAEPVVVGARSSEIRTILFVCRGDFRLAPGELRIKLEAIGGERLRAVASFADAITVPAEVEPMLEQITAVGGVSRGSLVFRREGAGAQ
jgi:hypothetical protein